MIIAVWCGNGNKPNDVYAYLKRFVEELQTIMQHGIHINSHLLNVGVRCFICDTPARVFIKGNFLNIFYFVKWKKLRHFEYFRNCKFQSS